MKSYIPFETLTAPVIDTIIREKQYYVILQRFNWPTFPPQETFIATPYDDLQQARIHADQLYAKEGKLLDLSTQDLATLRSLLESKKYFLFLNTFKDANWNIKTIKEYNKRIVSAIRSQVHFRNSDGLDIDLYFETGKLMAHIFAGTHELRMPLYDLIK